ncbi:GTPase HflX [Salarchaeum japonicum]|uniref:GTPase HflX n=1 Tax=Salarchaeum japonicum TaxID=555573 RepID=A0AAV3T1L2_9EURY|nr:GTPase HflX [Salarchaeum japonicum]
MSREDTAIVAKRVDESPADTGEIRALARSAGYAVAGEVVQQRAPHPGHEFGTGAIAELRRDVRAADADAVVVDNDLDANRAFALADRLPADTGVRDRKRLVIDIFGERAETRRAQLEVRLAELEYELPRAEERAKRGEDVGRRGFKSSGESPASQVRAAYKREIKQVEDALADIETADATRRADRHAAGFDLVALAGYTNAGKSTLLRRLADDHAVGENDRRHADLAEVAASHDGLFTTLNTTTRRATVGDHRLLVTDTVGFVSGLPHWLVDSFESTLASAYRADAVLLVADATDPPARLREKVATSRDVLADHRDADDGVVPVLNKVDAADRLDEKRRVVREVVGDPVCVSALDGDGLEALGDRLAAALPERETARFSLPQSDDAMSFVSWLYDHANAVEVTHGETVEIEVSGRPEVVALARGRASDAGADTAARRDS